MPPPPQLRRRRRDNQLISWFIKANVRRHGQRHSGRRKTKQRKKGCHFYSRVPLRASTTATILALIIINTVQNSQVHHLPSIREWSRPQKMNSRCGWYFAAAAAATAGRGVVVVCVGPISGGGNVRGARVV